MLLNALPTGRPESFTQLDVLQEFDQRRDPGLRHIGSASRPVCSLISSGMAPLDEPTTGRQPP